MSKIVEVVSDEAFKYPGYVDSTVACGKAEQCAAPAAMLRVLEMV